jgi:NAD(P)H dehydrogenase (quinone)
MNNVKLAIIYYSSTGANYQLSQWAAEAGREAGAEVKVLKVAELAPEAAIASNPLWKAHVEATQHVPTAQLDDLEWADAIIFSIPTRYGNMPSQLKQFIDSTGGLWYHGKLANKVVSGMATAQNPHGGQEMTIQTLYTTMHHWGAIIASPGYTHPALFAAGGNPYGTSASVEDGKIKEDVKEAVRVQTQRTLTIAGWIKAGLQGQQ